MKYMTPALLMAVALCAFALTGCGSNSTKPTGSKTTAESDSQGDHDHGDDGAHSKSDQTDTEKMKVELAKLSPEDAAAAESQHICPVSGMMLGKMGAPIKVDVNGQQVWICCEDCKDKLVGSPDKYLAKLKQE